jgi:Flp pilus assembly protein TadD
MMRDPLRRKARYMTIVTALLAATALSGCQKRSASIDSSDGLSTASTGPASYQATADLGKAWQGDKDNINKGLAFANALESIGQTDKQMDVYSHLVAVHPDNAKLAGIYGKKLLASGNSADAIPVLERAAAAPDADWRVHSALGTAYDQQSYFQKAREHYKIALAGDGGNLSVLNNLGMSFALEGNLKQAEITFRKADSMPRSRSEPRIRQNLALVVGLQGRFDEARTIASNDLPQSQVDANMAYLQKMLAQPNTWQQISEAKT